MQSLNVLIIGKGKFIEWIKSSKFLNKLYLASDSEVEGAVLIRFNTFKELAQKCRVLQIDIVLIEEEKWILEGIASVMKQYMVNCLAASSAWTKLSLSCNYAREITTKYGINSPQNIKLPVEFPVFVKGDGISVIANSMQEVISIKEQIYNTSGEIAKNVFLEKYVHGEKCKIISIYDGKHLVTFPDKRISKILLNEYSKKLETMLNKEKADFTGFINSEIIEENGILYNIGFSFEFDAPNSEEYKEKHPYDILYICLSALYQKLNEIDFS